MRPRRDTASRPPSQPPAPLTEETLRERALAHLARYAATEAGLARVLARGVDRWARRAVAAGGEAEAVAAQAALVQAAVPAVVRKLVAAGAVSDADFAAGRVRTLLRGGRSRRAVAAHLAAKGVGAETARAALDAGEIDELSAALVLARRRRIGPFREADADRRRELAVLARAGFSQDVARRALQMDHDAAESIVLRLRRGETP